MIYNKAKEMFHSLNFELDENQYEMFCNYEKLLLEWNDKINLTAITDDNDIWIKHFLDSCAISKYIKDSDSIIDIGTGAGFPGIPNLIINNTLNLTLLDSLNKRISFIKDVCDNLNLNNVKYIHGRAEDVAHDEKFREKYNVATARAVANLSTLVEYCLPFVKTRWNIYLYESRKC